jgi:hypothetical protein
MATCGKSGLVKLLDCHPGASTYLPPSLRSATGSSRVSPESQGWPGWSAPPKLCNEWLGLLLMLR